MADVPSQEVLPEETAGRVGCGLRSALVFGGPTLAILALVLLPVILGRDTFILRDVLTVHLMLKAPLAEALREGVLPVIDPYRAGGQPLLGNPNALPFYPDNVLFLLGPTLWALNAHFWLHLFLAPLSACWMGRAWGLSRSASWAAGVCYATSGYFLSQLNLYNLVAGAALVPALVASVLRAVEGRRWAYPVTGALWALLLLSGEPVMALLGGFLAASAAATRTPRQVARPRVLLGLLGVVALGTLVALPQVVELLRVLPATFRGYWGYGSWRFTVAAWHPVHALEWLVPLAFGRYELQGVGAFWARSLFAGELPLFLSLYPGVLGLALVLASGRPRDRGVWWAWAMVAAGLLLSAGGTHPLGRWLFDLPGAQSFRYPVKLFALTAVGATLLAGFGWDRVFGAGRRPPAVRPLAWPLAGIATLLAAIAAWVVLRPEAFRSMVLRYASEDWTAELAAAERARWIATFVLLGAVVAAFALALVLARRRPMAGAALLLALHGASQVQLLRGLRVTDEVEHYRAPSPLLASIPQGARVAHGEFMSLFGPSIRKPGPDHRWAWPLRQDFYSLIPSAGVLHGLQYELDRSPEGLDSFLARIAHEAVQRGPTDGDRVRGLARWGVSHVIVQEPLESVPRALARRVGTWPGVTTPVHLYRLAGPAPDVLFAETLLPVPHLNAAWYLLRSPAFDPERHVVLPGPEDAALPAIPEGAGAPQGRVRVIRSGPEALEVEVESPVAGVLVAQRSLLPVWRGTVDGEAVELEPANMYRIGVPVPAGNHRVRLWVDRTPLRWSLVGSAGGLLGLAALAFVARRRRTVGLPPGARGHGR